MILVACQAPDFTATAVLGTGEIIDNFNLKSFINNKIAILFFWPMDFTFVCPSEIISFNIRYPYFQKHNIQIVGVSCDSEFVHYAWRKIPLNHGGIGTIKYPMISDIKHEITRDYGIEHPNIGVPLRASFLIDSKGIIRHQIINDLPFGRNIEEIIRMIDALKFHEKYGEVCPAEWNKEKEGMTPTPEGVAKYLTKTYKDYK